MLPRPSKPVQRSMKYYPKIEHTSGAISGAAQFDLKFLQPKRPD